MIGVETINIALEAAGIGIWQLPLSETKTISGNTVFASLVDAGETNVAYHHFVSQIHSADRKGFQDAINNISVANPLDLHCRFFKKRDAKWHWIHFKGKLNDNDSHQKTIAGTAQDITTEVQAKQVAALNERLVDAAVKGTTVGLFSLDIKSGHFKYSPTFAVVLTGEDTPGLSRDEIVDHIHPDDLEIRSKAYDELKKTGDLLYEVRVIWNDGSLHWMSVVARYNYDDDNNPVFFTGTVQDVTSQRLKDQALQKAEVNFKTMVEHAPVAMLVFKGRDMVYEIINPPMLKLIGKTRDVIGKPLLEVLPEIAGQPVTEILWQVFDSGEEQTGNELPITLNRGGALETGYFNFTFTPLKEGDLVTGILEVATEVTTQVLERQKLQESENRLRAIIEEAPVATCLFVGRQQVVEIANEKMLRFWGKDKNSLGLPLAEAVPELDGQPFLDILDEVYTTGIPFTGTEIKAYLPVDGVMGAYYFDFTYQPLKNADGNVYAIMDMATDVTGQVLAKQAVTEAEDALHAAIEMAELGTWSYDVHSKKFNFSHRLREWYGYGEQEDITLDKCLTFIQPSQRELVKQTMQSLLTDTQRTFVECEFTVVNTQTGIERILQTQGKTVFNDEGLPIRVAGTAQDVTKQRQLQLALEQEVELRTNELRKLNADLLFTNAELNKSNYRLQHSNEELEQYAYVASHDLQEPLRKIRIFSDMLANRGDLEEENNKTLQKIIQSSERMSLLISDLLQFSRLLKAEAALDQVDINSVVHAVMNDFELLIEEKKAVIETNNLPCVQGIGLQLNQLFYNLFGNALKFVKPNVPPHIVISAHKINSNEAQQYMNLTVPGATYYMIAFADNGIGFEPNLAEKIFEVFKRLHTRDTFAGSGIGLALCRRIVANHNGHIFATSELDKGATFHIILPEKQEA